MAAKLTKAQAVKAVNRRGALLVFPLANRKEPASLWSEVWPRTKMRWEWTDDGDDRVVQMWHMRETLSRSRQVVYAKWFQGRATLFAFDVFMNFLSFLGGTREMAMAHETSLMMEALAADSPLSTKQLKAACELEGRLLEPTYNRAIKPLWNRLWIVGFGEFEDSSFPSLGIGASQSLFEDLWLEAANIDRAQAEQNLIARLGRDNAFFKYAVKLNKAQNLSGPGRPVAGLS